MRKIVEIKEEFEIPGTDIILEEGDRVGLMTEADTDLLTKNLVKFFNDPQIFKLPKERVADMVLFAISDAIQFSLLGGDKEFIEVLKQQMQRF